MTLPGNGTVKRIIAGIAVSVVVFLAGMVIANSTRITALEVKMDTIEKALATNRAENRDEHKDILAKVDAVYREVRK